MRLSEPNESEFTLEDIKAIVWVWKLSQMTLEQSYKEDGEVPQFVTDSLDDLKDRIIRLIKKELAF